MSKLHKWVMKNGGYGVASRKLGFDLSTVWRWAVGERVPNFQNMGEVIHQTGLTYEQIIAPAIKYAAAKNKGKAARK